MCNSLKCYPVHIKAPLICVTPIWGPKTKLQKITRHVESLNEQKNKQDMITQ